MIVTASLLPPEPPRLAEEANLQRSIVQYARWALPTTALMFHVPNGEKRSKKTGGILAGLGVRAGIPDLILFHDSQALCIEVKVKNTYPSMVQKQMHLKLLRCGIDTAVVRSLDEFIDAVEQFGVRLHARPT